MLKEWVNVYEEELNEEGIDAAIMLKEIEQKADIYRELSNQLFTNFLELVK